MKNVVLIFLLVSLLTLFPCGDESLAISSDEEVDSSANSLGGFAVVAEAKIEPCGISAKIEPCGKSVNGVVVIVVVV